MSDDRNPRRRRDGKRVKLPDGSWGVYMGETGGLYNKKPARRPETDPGRKAGPGDLAKRVSPSNGGRAAAQRGSKNGFFSKYSLSDDERKEAELRKKQIREGRSVKNSERYKALPQREPEAKKFYHKLIDRVHMWRLGIAINIESIIKAAVIGALVIVFAMLQITVFSELRPLGAIPDLMLPLTIAVGITEGERWGGACGLASAFLIDCLGSAGITLLPLIYVPCGFIAGVLGTYYLRDSLVIRVIFSVAAGIPRALVTVICVYVTYVSVNAGLMFSKIVLPEFISTLVFSILPHLAAWLCMKPFHKTRAERVE